AGEARPGHRRERLHQELRRADPPVRAAGPRLQGPRHRRLRAFRFARPAALLLRGQSPLRGGGGSEVARRPGRAEGEAGGRGDQEIRHRSREGGSHHRMTQVVVPDIGDFKDVAVIEVLVKPGDAVAKEQSLITLESDKATMEIPSPSDGVVREIKIKMGDKVSKGSPILELEAKDEAVRPQPRPEPKKEARQESKPEPKPTGDGSSTTVPVPDIGDFKEVEVIEVLVKPGDAVAKEQSLITLESDKSTMEIPSPSDGVVQSVKVKVGDKVSKGAAILELDAKEKAKAAEKPKPAEKAEKTSSDAITVPVPDIGDFKEVEVIEVLVKPGDAVTKEQSLITLESDKATMEIPSPGAGVVQSIKVKVGDKVAKGTPILVLEGKAGKTEAKPAPAPAPAAAIPQPVPAAAAAPRPVPREPREETTTKPHASPSVRKFARELGVDLPQVQGSGPKGRILHADVQAFVKGALSGKTVSSVKSGGTLPFNLPAWPEVDFAKFGPIESKPLSRIQKLSGPYLHRNWVSIP